jgi:hypothetical protein
MGRFLVIFALFFALAGLSAQPRMETPDPSAQNEVTIYLVPSLAKYDWSSPNSLYHSYIKNYWKQLFHGNCYLTGHAFLVLRSPVLVEEIIAGMRSYDRREQRRMVFQEHYGLSILGTNLSGAPDEQGVMEEKLEKMTRKGTVSFIRLYVNDEAFRRMLEFYEGFYARVDSMGIPSQCYGGAFWPRFYGEGSGCSAYVVSYLDVAGLLRDEFPAWRVEIDIPMELIGGPYNPGHEVKMKDIRKTRSWADGGTDGVDYESFWLFDPTLMHEWVLEKYGEAVQQDPESYQIANIGKARGIVIDARHISPPTENIFLPRNDPSVFIKKPGN